MTTTVKEAIAQLKDWIWIVLAVGGAVVSIHTVLNSAVTSALEEVAGDSATNRVTTLLQYKCESPESWNPEYEALLQKHLARYKKYNGREYNQAC